MLVFGFDHQCSERTKNKQTKKKHKTNKQTNKKQTKQSKNTQTNTDTDTHTDTHTHTHTHTQHFATYTTNNENTNLDQARLDVVVKHELRKGEELLAQELIGEVDGRVHDACAVRADGIGNVADVDCVQELVLGGLFHEDL